MSKLIADYNSIAKRLGHGSKPRANVSTRTSTNWGWNKDAARVDSKGKRLKRTKGVVWNIRYEG